MLHDKSMIDLICSENFPEHLSIKSVEYQLVLLPRACCWISYQHLSTRGKKLAQLPGAFKVQTYLVGY